MGKPVDMKKLEQEIKRETDPKKKRMLEKEKMVAQRDQIKRMKDFEAEIKKGKAPIAALQSEIKKEPDRDQAKKMMVMLDKHVKQMKMEEKREADAAKKSGSAAGEDPKAAMQRLKKFEKDVAVSKRPEDIKKLERVVAQEKDKQTKTKMMQKLKQAASKLKK